jgi:hypothetical protein
VGVSILRDHGRSFSTAAPGVHRRADLPQCRVDGGADLRSNSNRVTNDLRNDDARRFSWRAIVALFAGYVLLACAVQFWTGALPGGFGSHPDEGAHYVTGLMIRDFLLSGELGSPMGYALGYYAHYPAVALGHWPPGYYVLESLWMLVFGVSRIGVLVLSQLLAATVAVLVTLVARQRLGWGLSIWAGAVFLIVPVTRSAIGLTAPEMFMCVLIVLAALAYGRYLDVPTVRRGLVFGVLASAAMLTKGNAFLLALLPPVMILTTWRWALLRTPGFWAPLAVVLVLVGPWQFMTLRYTPQVLGQGAISGAATHAMPTLLSQMIEAVGWWSLPIVAAAAIQVVVQWKRYSTAWRVLIGVGIATVVFHLIVAAGLELRYMISAMPALALVLADGIDGLAARIAARRPGPARAATAFVCIAALVLLAVANTGWKNQGRFKPGGIGPAAATVMSDLGTPPAAILVSSQAYKEVAFVAEVAMRDTRRPHHYVIRGHKAFANTDWNGKSLDQRMQNEGDMVAYLDSVPVRYVVIDTAKGLWPVPHHLTLQRLVESRGEWARQPVPSDSGSARSTFLLYRRTYGNAP